MTPVQPPADVDPFIAERVVAIRDRFGLRGLRAAQELITFEMAIFEEIAAEGDFEEDESRQSG